MSTNNDINQGGPAREDSLFSEFSASSYDEWKVEAERLLKGAPFDKKMFATTDEGIILKPLYRKEDIKDIPYVSSFPGQVPFVRGGKAINGKGHEWAIAQEIILPDASSYNKALQSELNSGLTAINLQLDYACRKGLDPDSSNVGDVGFRGISIASKEELAKALESVNLEEYPIYIQAGASGLPYLGFLVSLAREKNIALEKLSGAVAMDPIGEMAVGGKLPALIDILTGEMAVMTKWAIENTPNLGTVWVHGEQYHNGGANSIQELAFAISTAVYYLRRLESHGVDIESAVPHFRFSFSAGSNIFMEIAKLRAARILWNQVLGSCEIPEKNRRMWIHVRTSHYNKTVYDPYVNMLRTTTEAFSGIVGGADSMHVTPFDDCIREADDFSRRIARNTQIILSEEAQLTQVIDPAGGSWYVESLTSQIVEKVWALIGSIETDGGMYQVLTDGKAQMQVAESSRQKAEKLFSRKKTAVGTNQYPHPNEEVLKRGNIDYEKIHAARSLEVQNYRTSASHNDSKTVLSKLSDLMNAKSDRITEAVIDTGVHGATVGEIIKSLRGDKAVQVELPPVPNQRQAVSFEMFRRTVENYRNESGKGKVFIASLGPVSKYMSRLDFAASFFEVGGFEVIRTTGFNTPKEAVKAAEESESKIIVICGLDDTYQEHAVSTAEMLKSKIKGCAVILAGKPTDEALQKKYQEAGVDIFIHVRSHVLKVLREVALAEGVV